MQRGKKLTFSDFSVDLHSLPRRRQRRQFAHQRSAQRSLRALRTMTGTPSIAKSPPALIRPAGPTPGGTLPLSSIDRATGGGAALVNLIQVFSQPSLSAEAAVAAMRDGLERALVPYYPVAGRVAPGGLAVNCTGEGVWFVEAAASCALANVDRLESFPMLIPGKLLLPRPPSGESLDSLILMAQATRFTCGGLAVGISFSHAVFDGQGVAQFLAAVGELARGLPAPSVAPVWGRGAIPDPPSRPPPQLTELRLVTQVADISAESIARVKDEFQTTSASTGESCSTLDAVTAVVFKCRALAVPGDGEVRVTFAAGIRHLLHGVLPAVDGYYGNCVHLACVARTSAAVRDAALAELVGAVREAKEAVAAGFARWMRGDVGRYDVPLDYSTMMLSDWSRLGLGEVDYGFGVPGYVFPLNDHVNFALGIRVPRRGGGIRLVLRCVQEPHAAAFAAELAKFA